MQEDKSYRNKMEAINKRTILAEKNKSWDKQIDPWWREFFQILEIF